MAESVAEAGCAHWEVVAPQQQWLGQQLVSAACNEAAEDSGGDDSVDAGFDCPIAP